jgi:VIT1/CCC1 family predicted Fe2+/Mn2+ transporter
MWRALVEQRKTLRVGATPMGHRERHKSERIGWLRAAVLGANDGIVSTASLVLGVAASGTARGGIVIAGIASLVAGAMSMAAGEYVSVSSQADTEEADLATERQELATRGASERAELARIYVARGVERGVADKVAEQLMAHDALGAHARDELGITAITRAKPVQAAMASAGAFSAGAAIPLLVVFLAPGGILALAVTGASLGLLAALGGLAARVGGAPAWLGATRVTFWGALAMALTYGIGALVGAVV